MQLPVRVITDSASDLPPSALERSGVRIVPLGVRFGDEPFVDRETIDGAAFWHRLSTSPDLPETSPPAPHRFAQEIKEAANDGAAGVVIVCMSSEISATYQSAVMAAEQLGHTVPTRVVDSRTVSMAQGFAAMAAAESAAGGASVDDVAAAAVDTSARTGILATLDTLDYLERGGRLGTAAVFFGNLLSVKPLLSISNGVVTPVGRTRSRTAAIAAIADGVLGLPGLQDVAILHGQARDVDRLVDALRPRIDPSRIVLAELGPVIGTHTGPGALGVAYTATDLRN